MLWRPNIFYQDILQRNYRKWSFSYNSFFKIVLFITGSLIIKSISMGPKHIVLKVLHFTIKEENLSKLVVCVYLLHLQAGETSMLRSI